MIKLYCIRRASDPPPPDDLRGIDRRPVRLHRVGSFSVWFSELDRSEVGTDAAAVHDRVVRSALRSATPLPCRFDSVLPDLGEVERVVTERGERLADQLIRVEGCVEIAVLVRPPGVGRGDRESDSARRGGGRAYMDAARTRHRRGRERSNAAEDLVRSGLRGLPVLDIVAASSRDDGLDVAVLVPRDGMRAVRDRIADLVGAGGAIVGSTGPWPPYTFAAFPGAS